MPSLRLSVQFWLSTDLECPYSMSLLPLIDIGMIFKQAEYFLLCRNLLNFVVIDQLLLCRCLLTKISELKGKF